MQIPKPFYDNDVRSGGKNRLFQFLGGVKAVIVDEIHAFAGDDRGWHLLAVLERSSRIANFEFQRIGLSATVGNPEELSKWFMSGCRKECVVQKSGSGEIESAEVVLDYVGSLENAAVVVSRLHKGKKGWRSSIAGQRPKSSGQTFGISM